MPEMLDLWSKQLKGGSKCKAELFVIDIESERVSISQSASEEKRNNVRMHMTNDAKRQVNKQTFSSFKLTCRNLA